MYKTLYFVAAFMLLITACSKKELANPDETMSDLGATYEAIGDSTIVGLACEGCTDSVLVLLFDDCADPVYYDIIEARKQHHIHGNPNIGDRIAVLINPNNNKEISFAVDLEQLQGSWTYEAMPKLKAKSAINDDERNLSKGEQAEMDSTIKALLVPHECGFTLKRDNTAQPIGRQWQRSALDEETPVEYPEVKRYSEWHIFNGKLILTERTGAPGDGKQAATYKISNDTAEVMMLSRDTLVLQFNSGMQGYSRKADK